jgi:hypothetical protein
MIWQSRRSIEPHEETIRALERTLASAQARIKELEGLLAPPTYGLESHYSPCRFLGSGPVSDRFNVVETYVVLNTRTIAENVSQEIADAILAKLRT